jgi:hypothetical protein
MAISSTPPPAHATQKSPDFDMSHVPASDRGAGHSNVPLIVVIVVPVQSGGDIPP